MPMYGSKTKKGSAYGRCAHGSGCTTQTECLQKRIRAYHSSLMVASQGSDLYIPRSPSAEARTECSQRSATKPGHACHWFLTPLLIGGLRAYWRGTRFDIT